jgi:hypothetical protein
MLVMFRSCGHCMLPCGSSLELDEVHQVHVKSNQLATNMCAEAVQPADSVCCCADVHAGPAAASRHHFLVVELQEGVPSCAADVWVQATQHTPAPPGGSSSSGAADTAIAAQQRSFLASSASALHAVQHSKSKSKSQKQTAAKANQDEALRRLQLQAPQQVQLLQGQQPQLLSGYQVHVAEVYEVLRVLQPQATSGAAAEGDGVESSSAASHPQALLPGWQYFDAHQGKWVCIQPSAAVKPSVPAAVSSEGVAR